MLIQGTGTTAVAPLINTTILCPRAECLWQPPWGREYGVFYRKGTGFYQPLFFTCDIPGNLFCPIIQHLQRFFPAFTITGNSPIIPRHNIITWYYDWSSIIQFLSVSLKAFSLNLILPQRFLTILPKWPAWSENNEKEVPHLPPNVWQYPERWCRDSPYIQINPDCLIEFSVFVFLFVLPDYPSFTTAIVIFLFCISAELPTSR